MWVMEHITAVTAVELHGTVATWEISPEISQETYHDVELLFVPAMILGYSICTWRAPSQHPQVCIIIIAFIHNK